MYMYTLSVSIKKNAYTHIILYLYKYKRYSCTNLYIIHVLDRQHKKYLFHYFITMRLYYAFFISFYMECVLPLSWFNMCKYGYDAGISNFIYSHIIHKLVSLCKNNIEFVSIPYYHFKIKMQIGRIN